MPRQKYSQIDMQSTPIYNQQGRKVGDVVGDTLVKDVRYSRHYFRLLGGWACDSWVLEQAELAGVTKLKYNDKERKKVYKAPLDAFKKHGIPICYPGYGPQLCLPSGYWKYSSMPKRNQSS